MRQLLDHAAENGYALPAFNVNNLEQVQAIMAAADQVNAPVIMQASAGARNTRRSVPAPPDRSRGRVLSTHPGRHASGPRAIPRRLHGRDPQRFHERHDGRFARS